MNAQQLGEAAPRRGNKITRGLAKAALALFGWRVMGQIPDLPKFVMIGGPHTSNWDFPIAMLLFIALGIRVSWMAKREFVGGPLGWLWRWMGGVGIDRRAAHGVVEQMVDAFEKREKFVLAIAPEGTRSKVKRWKSGFYHIAQGANVPIFPIVVDYGRKKLQLHPVFAPSGELTADLPQLQALYADVKGKRPDKQ